MTIVELRKLKFTSPDKAYYESILNTVLNTAIAEGKRIPADADILPAVKSLAKEAQKAADIYFKYGEMEKVAEIKKEIEFFNQFLPAVVSETELIPVIQELKNSGVDKKSMFAILKQKYGETIDMKLASRLIN